MTQEQLISIAKGAAISALGAGLTFLSSAVTGIDFGPYTGAIVAVMSVAVNAVRKYFNILA